MKLIVGGVSQGKTEYAKKTFGLKDEEFLDGAVCDPSECRTARAVKQFHLLVRRICGQGTDPLAFAKELAEENPEIIILQNEIGGGIVPLQREERIWREWAGRVGCFLAGQAELVVRMQCGIAVVLKGKTE